MFGCWHEPGGVLLEEAVRRLQELPPLATLAPVALAIGVHKVRGLVRNFRIRVVRQGQQALQEGPRPLQGWARPHRLGHQREDRPPDRGAVVAAQVGQKAGEEAPTLEQDP